MCYNISKNQFFNKKGKLSLLGNFQRILPNTLGFKKDYRIYHINAFDTEKNNVFLKKKSRKWSDGL